MPPTLLAPMPDAERIRLVVLFGGRSAEHDVSCIVGPHVLRGRRPRPLRRRARRHHPRRAAGCAPATPSPPSAAGAAALPVARRRAGGPAEVEPLPTVAPAIAGRAGRRPAAAARPDGRGRHRAGPARAGRRPLRRRRRAGSALCMDKALAKDVLAAPRPPPVPLARPPATRASTTPRRRACVDRARAARVREAGQPRLVGRRHQGPRRRRAGGAPSPTALAYDEYVVVEEARRRPRDRGRGARQRGRRGRRCRARSSRPRVLRLRRQVPRRRAPTCCVPAPPRRRRGRRGAAARGRAPTGRCGSTAWPGSTSSTRRAAAGCSSTSSTRSPGFTPISMYPKLWEASGLSLRRAGRRARPPGRRAPRAPRAASTDRTDLTVAASGVGAAGRPSRSEGRLRSSVARSSARAAQSDAQVGSDAERPQDLDLGGEADDHRVGGEQHGVGVVAAQPPGVHLRRRGTPRARSTSGSSRSTSRVDAGGPSRLDLAQQAEQRGPPGRQPEHLRTSASTRRPARAGAGRARARARRPARRRRASMTPPSSASFDGK